MSFSRRKILAAGAAGGALTATAAAHAAGVFGNPDLPPEGQVNANARAFADPGPQDPVMEAQLEAFQNPPPTDVGGMAQFWSSFNIVPKRVQAGGWARQVTTEQFPISVDYRRREHAARAWRHSRTALAPAGGMGDHDLWPVPRDRAWTRTATLSSMT